MNIDGYNLYRTDGCQRRGGGVAIYVRNTADACEIHMPGDDPLYEVLWLRVHFANSNIIFGALYNPPKPRYQTHEFPKFIELIILITQPTIALSLLEILMLYRSNRLRTACPHSPTHPRSQPNYLDHIYVSEPCYSVVEVVCSTIKSDHRAVIASASNTNITYLHKVKTQHQYRKCTPDQHAAYYSPTYPPLAGTRSISKLIPNQLLMSSMASHLIFWTVSTHSKP